MDGSLHLPSGWERSSPRCVLCHISYVFDITTTSTIGALLPAAQAGVEHILLKYAVLNSSGERALRLARQINNTFAYKTTTSRHQVKSRLRFLDGSGTYLDAVWQAESYSQRIFVVVSLIWPRRPAACQRGDHILVRFFCGVGASACGASNWPCHFGSRLGAADPRVTGRS